MEALYSEEMETNVLGSIFLQEQLIKDANSLLSDDDFYDELNRNIFKSFKELYNQGVKIDYSTVWEYMTKKKLVKEDDLDYILGLTNAVPSTANIMFYIQSVSEWGQKRKLYNQLDSFVKTFKSDNVEDLEKKLKDMVSILNDGKSVDTLDGFVNLFDCFDDYVNFLETPVDTDNVFKLGFPNLDSKIMVEKTNLMIIGADTGVGKTAFALNLVNNFCKQNKQVFFVSQEMGRNEVLRRMIALIGEVNAQSLKRKELTQEEWTRVMSAKEKTKGYKLNTYDKGNMSIEMLYTIVSRLKKKGLIDVLVVDYLQLIEVKSKKQNRANEVAYVSRKLKQMAMEFDIPVILLSQLNRSIHSNDGTSRAPQKSDLKESSSIEQDANIIVMLHTTDTEQKFQHKRYVELYIRKQRDGVLGKTTFNYYGDNVKFVETEYDKTVGTYVEVEYDNTDTLTMNNETPTIDVTVDDLPF